MESTRLSRTEPGRVVTTRRTERKFLSSCGGRVRAMKPQLKTNFTAYGNDFICTIVDINLGLVAWGPHVSGCDASLPVDYSKT